MLKNTKSNSKKPASGYDRIEFYIDFVQVLLSAFMLGYVIGKQNRERTCQDAAAHGFDGSKETKNREREAELHGLFDGYFCYKIAAKKPRCLRRG